MPFWTKRKTNHNPIVTDVHSHLIPGIDDGPKSMDESVELVKGLANIGFKNLWATSHVYWEHYPNEKDFVLQSFKKLKEEIRHQGIDVKIECAAEYYLDEKFIEFLENDQLITFPNKHLLIETSTMSALSYLEEYIFKIRMKGYNPILAHPERYEYMDLDFEIFERLKTMGCLFQVNLLSIEGYYGKSVKKLAKKLLKNDMIDLVGTDLHNKIQLNLLSKFTRGKDYRALCENPMIQNNSIF